MREKLDEEYRKAVDAMRRAAANEKIGNAIKANRLSGKELPDKDDDTRRTDHKLAKANGTNRTYLNDA
jgi:hypothetical protein